jgi:hypothetical protein
MNSGSSEIVVLPQRDSQFRVTKKCCLTLDRCRMIGFYLAQGWRYRIASAAWSRMK